MRASSCIHVCMYVCACVPPKLVAAYWPHRWRGHAVDWPPILFHIVCGSVYWLIGLSLSAFRTAVAASCKCLLFAVWCLAMLLLRSRTVQSVFNFCLECKQQCVRRKSLQLQAYTYIHTLHTNVCTKMLEFFNFFVDEFVLTIHSVSTETQATNLNGIHKAVSLCSMMRIITIP